MFHTDATASTNSAAKISQLSPKVKWALFLFVFIFFWAAYPWMYGWENGFYRIFALVYLMMAAFFWGAGAGVAAIVLGVLMGFSFHRYLGLSYSGGFYGIIVALVLVFSISWLRTTSIRLEEELEKSREAGREREELIGELEEALAEVKTLRGLIPVCSYCKKIRDDGGVWQAMERYIQDRSDAVFSHGICPECYETTCKELLDKERSGG